MSVINYESVVLVGASHPYKHDVRVTGVGVEAGCDLVEVGPTYHRPKVISGDWGVELDPLGSACGVRILDGVLLHSRYVEDNGVLRACKKKACFG